MDELFLMKHPVLAKPHAAREAIDSEDEGIQESRAAGKRFMKKEHEKQEAERRRVARLEEEQEDERRLPKVLSKSSYIFNEDDYDLLNRVHDRKERKKYVAEGLAELGRMKAHRESEEGKAEASAEADKKRAKILAMLAAKKNKKA
jgi:hypothetical protein